MYDGLSKTSVQAGEDLLSVGSILMPRTRWMGSQVQTRLSIEAHIVLRAESEGLTLISLDLERLRKVQILGRKYLERN